MLYVETRLERPINWALRLSYPIEDLGEVNFNDWNREASSWVTCACGNQCDAIPRRVATTANGFSRGEPVDEHLKYLGIEFSKAISTITSNYSDGFYSNCLGGTKGPANGTSNYERDFSKAKEVLAAIEKRSLEILKQLGKYEVNT